MKRFQVPRRAVDVRVLLRSGKELAGALYAAASSPDGRPGCVGERLNDDSERFLAMGNDRRGCLLNKAWILTVEVDAAETQHELEQTAAMREVSARVKLAGGTTLEGRLPYSMPPGRGRLLDYLNDAPRFMPLVRANRLAFVNRDFVTAVDATAPDADGAE